MLGEKNELGSIQLISGSSNAQNNVYIEYLAARTIQRWFRGYVTRNHLAFLNSCATMIQKHWRGYVDRKYYNELLKIVLNKETAQELFKEQIGALPSVHYGKISVVGLITGHGHLKKKLHSQHFPICSLCDGQGETAEHLLFDRPATFNKGALCHLWYSEKGDEFPQENLDAVHKMFLEYYNQMATKIQKVWRGHHVRTHIFSYYKLKAYINEILNKNREFLEEAKDYEAHTKHLLQKMKQEECQEWLSYLSFRVHHLIRTHQIEGVYSNHGTCEYSNLEQHLKNAKFKDYMDLKLAKEKQKQLKEPQHNYIFEGRLRECEEVWLHRNDPGKYSLATGEYGRDKQEYQQRRKISQILHQHQDIP
ncbi:spermatogenesis-associated protein 17 [Homalodisca vitripennis]|nr:spermatogenesis-associated protein 17 [Homalodisca vitripennis]